MVVVVVVEATTGEVIVCKATFAIRQAVKLG